MRSFAISSLVLFAVGCGGHDVGNIDEVIGESCASDRDCDGRCYVDPSDFPGGFCSVPCSSDNDCPDDTFCMAEEGGMCLFICPEFDCNRLGPAWSCKDKSRLNGGSVSVCIGD